MRAKIWFFDSYIYNTTCLNCKLKNLRENLGSVEPGKCVNKYVLNYREKNI